MPSPRRTPERARFFATCARGLEPVLHAEVRALRLSRVERQVGGVYFEGDLRAAWRANLWLRTAVRVLMRVARFSCPDEAALYAGAGEVDWSRFLAPEGQLVVDAHSSESALTHTRFVEQRVKDAIVDQLRDHAGARPSVGRVDADLGVYAHLFRDRCTLLVDTSGGALHRRGWRRAAGEAPLAETLAAGVVQLSEWDGRAPFLDPFCGSGTLLVEAALLAHRIAPGLLRARFGFERWRDHDAAGWSRERDLARDERVSPRGLTIRGGDVDPAALEHAAANVAGAGLEGAIELEETDARDLAPRPGWNAWIVANLPYGRRLGGGQDLDGLYRRFGEVLRGRCAGFHANLLCPDGPGVGALGLGRERAVPLSNGGLDCLLVRSRIGD